MNITTISNLVELNEMWEELCGLSNSMLGRWAERNNKKDIDTFALDFTDDWLCYEICNVTTTISNKQDNREECF